ncbi:MAG: SOS response-associated peptidase [Cyclobacteriaceae bacterium]
MYDRYSLYSAPEKIESALAVEVPGGYTPNYNCAPTQLLPVITNEDKRGLSFFHWGLMAKWSNNKSISAKSINLSAESAFQKTSYKRQIQSHRCIVPINGFYAWKRVSKKQLVPHYYFPTNTQILGIAGLWEEFEDIDGSVSHSFILLTVRSSNPLMEIEEQMPAILEPINCLKWLESDDLEMCESLIFSITKNHSALGSHPVSPAITKIENNYPELINAVPASDQHGNYTLFT